MASLRHWVRTHPALAVAAALAQVAIFATAFIGIARATDSPSFCTAACHEMTPYHNAWQAGPHSDISCVSCHVDAGTIPRLEHKVVALGELWMHFTGEPTFPLENTSPVPDERCRSCHESIRVTAEGFDHAAHENRGPCQSCHANAGHEVSTAALKDAGVFNPDAQKEILAGRVAVVGQGVANVPGHVLETCSNCHDMAKTGCGSCHEPRHENAGPATKTASCTTCHAPGVKFVFAHPDDTECSSCHATPARHEYRGACTQCHEEPGVKWAFSHGAKADCSNCHERPQGHRAGACSTCHESGAAWTFRHPAATSNCTSCHDRPRGHRTGSCTTCHAAGSSWAFKHPAASSACTACHNRPGGHRSGACVTCHATGTTWAFKHPGAKATCTSCHARPSGHRSGSCTTCHKVGTTWRFSHPSASSTCANCHTRPGGHSSGGCGSCHRTGSWAFVHSSSGNCASCHRAPSNHYGTSCASCHSPGKLWASATFSHPRVPGGKHTYRSFACNRCHPGGYSSYSCTSCHDSNSPNDDDD